MKRISTPIPSVSEIPLHSQQHNDREEKRPGVPKRLSRLLLNFELFGVLGKLLDQLGQFLGGNRFPPVMAARLSIIAASAEALSSSRSCWKTMNRARAVPSG